MSKYVYMYVSLGEATKCMGGKRRRECKGEGGREGCGSDGICVFVCA